MEDFLQDKPKKRKSADVLFRGYRRLFVLVFAVAVLWQALSFVQMRLSDYHQQLTENFKILMPVVQDLDNDALAALGESLSTKKDITAVKLFSPQDALTVLRQKNARLADTLVLLGHEQMPAYFELKISDNAINNIRPFTQNLAVEYPQLSLKFSAEQADLALYSGLCLRVLNMAYVFALVLFFAFMFMVEAYPIRGKTHVFSGVISAMLAGLVSLILFLLVLYPTGFLADSLRNFTTLERQLGILAFCGLFGWTLSKWQKF